MQSSPSPVRQLIIWIQRLITRGQPQVEAQAKRFSAVQQNKCRLILEGDLFAFINFSVAAAE